jgi:cysteine-rich repeat protein
MRRLAQVVFSLGLTLHAGQSAAASLGSPERERLAASRSVGAKVVRALETREKVRVLIAFSVPPATASRAPSSTASASRARIALAADRILGRFAPGEFDLARRYGSIQAVAGSISAKGLLKLLDDPGVMRVDLDEGGSGGLAEALPLVSLDSLHGLGLRGDRVTVAVIDSGVDTDHPDLVDRIVAQKCFCQTDGGCCPPGDTTTGNSAEDDNGHGTNVTGVLTSAGTVAPVGGAPDVRVVSVKVLSRDNAFCCVSDVLAAMDWIIDNRADVDIVNLSLGTFALFEGDCDEASALGIAGAAAVNALRARGVLTFASAMNDGSAAAMALPACLSRVISVGAVYDSDVGPFTFGGVCTDATTAADQVACFSNSSLTTDLLAPGALMTATGLSGTVSTYAGTSQASPLAAACAATLLGVHPASTPDEIEGALESSPTRLTDPKNGLVYPRVDCEGALLALGCGDGVGDPEEACDDGNLLSGDGCDVNCTVTACGNGIVTAGEQCDDGNLAGGDGCEPDCGATPFVGLSGKRLVLRDHAVDPRRRRLLAVSRDPVGIATSALRSPGDPTVGGAVLRLRNPRTGETAVLELPAQGWDVVEGGDGTSGYRYRDPRGELGPCKRVVVKPGRRLLRAACRGAGIPFTLDEPAQGSLAASLALGASPAFCMEFGGAQRKDFGIGSNLNVPLLGRFRRSEAPAPTSCASL